MPTLTVVLAVLASPQVAIPAPPPPPPAPQPSTTPPAELVAQLDRLVAFRQVTPDGQTAVSAIDADGNDLTASNADVPMTPASTMKLATAAAALRLLGPDHRFVTRVHATAPPDDAGVVDGDLLLVGGGDPVLATPRFIRKVNRDRPATQLRELARAVARAGVTRITGRVAGDATILADQPIADGWRDDDLTALDTARSSGLTVDAGLRLFTREGTLRAEAARNPAARAASQFAKLLDDAEIRIERDAAPTTAPREPRVEIARITSPPLSDLLVHMVQTSDNHLADGIFRMLGAAIGDPTWRGSAEAARRVLDDAGIDWDTARLADGSGLSRHDRVTADALVHLLRVMADGPDRQRWFDLLAVAGESGTMRRRLVDTPARGRVLAKTGTLRDVRAMAGTVPGAEGGDQHFAVLANDLDGWSDTVAARRLADVVALALVVSQDGCDTAVVVPDAKPKKTPEAVLCPVEKPRGA